MPKTTNLQQATSTEQQVPPQLLRVSEVVNITGVGKSTIYRWMRQGTFPQTLDLGGGMVAFVASEVQQWVDEKIAKRDASTINKPVNA